MSSGYLLRSPQESRSYTTWAKHWMPLSYKTLLSQHLFCQHFQFICSLFLSWIISSVSFTYSSFAGHSDLCQFVLLCTFLWCSRYLLSVDIYYGQEEGRWSVSLMTVLTGSNKWRGGWDWGLVNGTQHTLYYYVYLKQNKTLENKQTFSCSLFCFISQK